MTEKAAQNYQALIRRIKKKNLFFTEGQTGHASDTNRPRSKTGFRRTPLLSVFCQQLFYMLHPWPIQALHSIWNDRLFHCQHTALPSSKLLFLNTVMKALKSFTLAKQDTRDQQRLPRHGHKWSKGDQSTGQTLQGRSPLFFKEACQEYNQIKRLCIQFYLHSMAARNNWWNKTKLLNQK